MKKCPDCSQFFSDDNFFCLNCGTSLLHNADMKQNPTSFQTPNDTPTQLLSSFPTKTVEKKEAHRSFYLIIGAMAVLIIGLSAIVFFLLSGKDSSENKTGENKQQANQIVENNSVSNSALISQVEKQIPQIEKSNKQIYAGNTQVQTEPITNEAVQDLLNRWRQAQNARNYNAYKACYAPQFFGIKRTRNGGETRMNYGQWMNDRRKMLKNTINVGIQIQDIKTEGDTATSQFIQQFESVNYQDTGQKILKIKMFSDGAKIIYEELKYAY